LHAAGVRQRNPTATAEDIRVAWMQAALGKALVDKVKEALRERHG
jgi:hypothetical protein